LPLKHEKCREIPRIFDITAVQGHPRGIDLDVNGKPICDFLLVIIVVTLAVSATVFEILTLKDGKLLILPVPPLFDAAARGTP